MTTTACRTQASFTCFHRKGLEAILPHRAAALRMIDGVFFDHRTPERILGFKHVLQGETELDGHFPAQPTYPGYAQDEFACLTAAALILHTVDGLDGNPYVVQKTVRYKRTVSPGDRLTAAIRLEGTRSRFFLFSGEIRNQHNDVVAEYERIMGAV
jgi:3-hydroxymyristoyl/3-hydroxydecanoyl-(acyl carrier protein) dehydratase